MQIEVDNSAECDELLIVKYYDFGMGFNHNYPCTVCRDKSAVLDCSTGIMQPCWHCQSLGYSVKQKSKFARMIERYKK